MGHHPRVPESTVSPANPQNIAFAASGALFQVFRALARYHPGANRDHPETNPAEPGLFRVGSGLVPGWYLAMARKARNNSPLAAKPDPTSSCEIANSDLMHVGRPSHATSVFAKARAHTMQDTG